MATDEATWIEARILKVEKSIVAYEDALDAIAEGAQMYTLDTGQTRTVVSRANVSSIKTLLQSLENRRRMLLLQLNGGGASIARGI